MLVGGPVRLDYAIQSQGMGEDRDSKRDRKEKHSHRDRDRKERDRDRERDKDRRHRDREPDKDRGDRHKSSRHEREHRPRTAEDERRSKRKSDRDSRPREEEGDAAAKRPRLESASPHPPKPDELPAPPPVPSAAAAAAEEEGRDAERAAAPLPPPPARAPSPPAQPSNWAVQESGGEVSMSIEETNRMRISLGLKPLAMDSTKEKEDQAARAAHDKKRAEQKQAEADLLAQRVKEKKEQRLQDQKLRQTRTLGAQEPEGDDLLSWVSKSRQLEQERAKAGRMAALLQEQDKEAEGSSDEDEDARPAADHLAGLKVRHKAEDLGEGETVIMTLADHNILDARGNLDEDADELENVLAAERTKREKARKAATNAGKPLWDEDGQRRGLLDKYDEQEEDASMTVGSTGRLEAKLSRADETRQRLAAAQERVQQQDAPSMAARGDFMSAEEVAFQQKKGKKVRKKLRKKAAEDEEMLDLDALEAAADAAAPSDHGSRRGGRDQAAEAAAARAEEQQKRRARYENALEKANYAQLAKAQEEAAADQAANEDDEQEALDAQLARARRAAHQRSSEGAAQEAAQAAAGRQRQAAEAAAAVADADGMSFTEAGEFARFIQPVKQEVKPEPEPQAPSVVPTPTPAPSMRPPPPRQPSKKAAGGSWRGEGASGEPGDDVMDIDMEADEEAAPPESKVKLEAPEMPVTRQRAVGGGLAGALELLKDRGELRNTVEWGGRTSDKRSDKLELLADVYTGGRHTDRIAADIETALTRRDEFGRVMTPKEAFRELCYKFHGKDPSKNKQEKRIRKWEEEQAVKKAAASEQSFAGLATKPPSKGPPAGNVPRTVATREPPAPYAGQDTPALTPMLGGGDTPLQGKKKVAVMLGMASPHKRK